MASMFTRRRGAARWRRPPHAGRTSELVELCDAFEHKQAPLLDARWGMATTEVCLAILRSSRERREVLLEHQVALAADR